MNNYFSFLFVATLLALSCTALTAQAVGEELGMASYFADDFAGKRTASGTLYNPAELVCGHKRHPMGTMLKVTRLDNNKTVTVRVVDHSPYITGRIIELSRAAAERLDMIQQGVVEVKVEVAGAAKAERKTETAKTSEIPQQARQTPTSFDAATARIEDKPKETAKAAETKKAETAAATEKTAATTDSKTAKARLVGKDFQQYGLYKIALEKPAGKGFAVQVASLENYENVFKQVADLQAKWFENILVSIEKGKDKPVYKIMLGTFDTEAAANNYQKSLQSKHKIRGFVVNLSQATY